MDADIPQAGDPGPWLTFFIHGILTLGKTRSFARKDEQCQKEASPGV
ncbi:MAG: hypothetical protein AAGE93_02720 [Bacteroidota bacterium]